MPPRNANGLSPLTRDQRASGKGQDNDDPNGAFINGGFITSTTTSEYSTKRATTTRDVLDELEEWDAPLPPLAALLASDASYSEIVSRLRLNFAIRMLLEAIAEADAAGAL